jgi:diadenosine tetraphosphate (Ap4A) HIT family hydrolase
VFRRRHVAALTDLAPDELADYWLDIQDVGRAIERVFKPCHVNYQLLGNMVPHLHVHIVPRYLDDAAPQRPLPFEPSLVGEEDFARRASDLREVLTSGR